MNTPWMRMVLILTMFVKRPNPQLLYDMAHIMVQKLPCPGKASTVDI